MGLVAVTVFMECDGCGVGEDHELERDESPDNAVDAVGWLWHGTLLDRLLCPECTEKEEAA